MAGEPFVGKPSVSICNATPLFIPMNSLLHVGAKSEMLASVREGALTPPTPGLPPPPLALRCPLVTHNAADFAGVPNLMIITEPQA